MSESSPFTLLNEIINPIIEAASEEFKLSDSEFIKLFSAELAEGVQQEESAEIDIYAYKSNPAIVIGDRLAYEAGNRDMDLSKVKAKFFTEQIKISENAYNRILQNNNRPTQLIANGVRDQIKRQNRYFIKEMEKMVIVGLASGEAQDSKIYKVLGPGPSSNATLADPYDLNATPGSAYDGSAFKLSGVGQTINNITQILALAFKGLTKIDTTTGDAIPYTKIYCGVDKMTYAILRGTNEIISTSSGQRSEKTLLQIMEAAGITVVVNQQFDADYTGTAGDTAVMTFFTDPVDNVHMVIVPDGKEESWSEWYKVPVISGKKMSFYFEKHKAKEVGFWAQPYWIHSDDDYYKMVWRITVTPYATS